MAHPYGLFLEYGKYSSKFTRTINHIHDEMYELTFLVSGQRRCLIESTLYDIAPGDLVCVPPGLLHRTTTMASHGFERYVIYFYPDNHRDFIQTVGEDRFRRLMESGCLRFPPHIVRQIKQDLDLIRQELAAKNEYTSATARHLLRGILLTALKHGTPKPPSRGEHTDKIQWAAQYIRDNYNQPLPLDRIAELAGMDRSYFSRRFKQLTGFGFSEYLTQIRLRQAEHLLLQTKLSVSEISELCGFNSSHYFADTFRRSKGMSPSQYRKGRKGNECLAQMTLNRPKIG